MSKMQAPRGCPDIFPSDIEKRLHIVNLARKMARNYGFHEYETPIFEHSEVFIKNLGEGSDIVSKEMYSFADKGGEQFTLRPEATASVARMAISHKMFRELPIKVFYQGPMFRHERPQMGRQRQFTQIGVECLGIKDPKIDAEIIELGWNILKKLNISQDSVVQINSLGSAKDRETYKKELVKYLTNKKTNLSEDSQRRLETNPLRILDSKSEQDKEILKESPNILNYLNTDSIAEFEKIQHLLKTLNVPFIISSQLVRGLDYYNDTVFEITHGKLGAQSTVLAGGRYDTMIENMGGPSCPSFGWASGLERLSLLVDYESQTQIKIGIVDMDHSNDDFLMTINQTLHQSYETYWSPTGNFSKQMKKCESQNCSYVILFGNNEVKNNSVQIKNLKDGSQQEVMITNLSNYQFK